MKKQTVRVKCPFSGEAKICQIFQQSFRLYIRLSKEDENEGPSQSVTNQQSLLNESAEQNHLPVYDTYVDDGWSGTSFDRPSFRRMIADIEAGKVNPVITKDLSRLGRDYILVGHCMERYFPENRCAISLCWMVWILAWSPRPMTSYHSGRS